MTKPVPEYSIRGFPIWGFRDMAQCLDFFFQDGRIKPGILVAMNAEKILTAEREPELRALLEAAEYKYADGISIVRSIRRKYPDAQVARIAGADLWQALMQRAGQAQTPVYLVGGKPETLRETHDKLINQWQVNIVGCHDGYFFPDERQRLMDQIQHSGAQIVTVALGSPRQELFMRDCQAQWPSALYMGVGGTYDVFTGHVKRAPKKWQDLGLEWLYRLITQPSRLRRQLRLLKYQMYYYRNKL